MEKLLLAAHVVAGILLVGPVAVTTSLFPRYAPVTTGPGGTVRSASVATGLHRITRVYGSLALAVPVIGLVLAAVQGRLSESWITAAMVLTAVAGGVLVLRITPTQADVVALLGRGLLPRTRLAALLPLVGGVLTMVNVRREARR